MKRLATKKIKSAGLSLRNRIQTLIRDLILEAKKFWILLVVNCAGLLFDLYQERKAFQLIHPVKTAEGWVLGGGDLMVGGLMIGPFLLVMFLLNVIWLLYLLGRKKKWPSLILWFFVGLAWIFWQFWGVKYFTYGPDPVLVE